MKALCLSEVIHVISCTDQTKQYFIELLSETRRWLLYQNSENTELYQWFGKGANELGLDGAIDNGVHAQIYSGRLPNGEAIGKPMPDGKS